jgi:hypothetical protein
MFRVISSAGPWHQKPAAAIGGEILVGEQATIGLHGSSDATCHVTLVEHRAPGLDGLGAVGAFAFRGSFRIDHRAQGRGEVRLAEQLADVEHAAIRVVGATGPFPAQGVPAVHQHRASQRGVHREAIGQAQRGLQHLGQRHRAELLQRQCHRIDDRRDGAAIRPIAWNDTGCREQRGPRRPGRGPLPTDHTDLARGREISQHGRFTAKTEIGDLVDRGGQHRSHAGIEGIAAGIEHAGAGLHGVVRTGRHDAAPTQQLLAERGHLFGTPCRRGGSQRRWRRGLRCGQPRHSRHDSGQ